MFLNTEGPAVGPAPWPAFYRKSEDVGHSVGAAVSREKASLIPLDRGESLSAEWPLQPAASSRDRPS